MQIQVWELQRFRTGASRRAFIDDLGRAALKQAAKATGLEVLADALVPDEKRKSTRQIPRN